MPSDKAKPIDRLAHLLHQSERSIAVTNDTSKRHLGSITGVIVDILDPAEKGRVKVKLDPFRHEYIAEMWCPVIGAYQGLQPKQLVGQKCLIAPIEGSVHLYRVIGLLDGDVGTFDPDTDQGEMDFNIDSVDYGTLQDLKPMSSRTGFMFRHSVYNLVTDALPKCHAGNHGISLVFDDGVNSRVLTCLRQKGGFLWSTNQRVKLTQS